MKLDSWFLLVVAVFVSGLPMFLFDCSLFEGLFLGHFAMKLGSWHLLVLVVFVSVLLMFLFDCSFFEDFVFEALCHERGFLAFFGFGGFCECFAYVSVWLFCFFGVLFLRFFTIKLGSWFFCWLVVSCCFW